MELSARLAHGDPAGLEECYRRWSPLIYTLALRRLRATDEADEVTQNVFVSAWTGRHRLTPSEHALPAWLIAITRHRIADKWSERQRHLRLADAVADQPSAGSYPIHDDTREDRMLVRSYVDALTEPRRSVVKLAFYDDLTHDENAHRLGMPLGTVKSHVRRGLLTLRAQMKEAGVEAR